MTARVQTKRAGADLLSVGGVGVLGEFATVAAAIHFGGNVDMRLIRQILSDSLTQNIRSLYLRLRRLGTLLCQIVKCLAHIGGQANVELSGQLSHGKPLYFVRHWWYTVRRWLDHIIRLTFVSRGTNDLGKQKRRWHGVFSMAGQRLWR